jgi:hypothetical protein
MTTVAEATPVGSDDPAGDDTERRPRCSRAGCGSPAIFSVNWRNPKIHGADRVKVWLACAEHVDYLRGFLEARDFPVSVAPIVRAP